MKATFLPWLDALVSAARETGAEVEPLASELLGQHLRQEVWAGDAAAPHESRASRDLPDVKAGYRIDGMPVLFGVIVGEPTFDTTDECLRRYRNQAIIARSWLDSDAANLQLFLVAPPGSATDVEWHSVAALIEGDDRICRKLVWLTPDVPSPEAAADFLTRTFLATPWRSETPEAAHRLDAMSSIRLPEGWEDVVNNAALDAEEIVLRLVEVETE